jgi:uridine kinase
VPDDVRLARRLNRDVMERGRTAASVMTQYEATVRPMHREFVEPCKAFADVVLPDGEKLLNGREALLARARQELAARRPDLVM